MTLSIIIVDKLGSLKSLKVKNFCEEELYKRCGFKKDNNFSLRYTMSLTLNGDQHYFSLYGKSEGKSNLENQYPLLSTLKLNIYGNFAIVGYDELHNPTHLSIEQWEIICEQLNLGNNNLSVECVSSATQKPKSCQNVTTSSQTSEKICDENEYNERDELVEDEYYYSSDEDNE